MLPAQAFRRLEGEQHVGRARGNLRRQHLVAEAQMRGHDTAALRHAGHFGFLGIVAECDGRFSQDFGCGHDALATDADNENIGDIAHLRPRIPWSPA